MKVDLYVEVNPMQIERAVSFASNVEVKGDRTEVYLDKERAILALALLSDVIGAEVIYQGERVELEL